MRNLLWPVKYPSPTEVDPPGVFGRCFMAVGERSELEGLGNAGDDAAPTCKAVLMEVASAAGVCMEPRLVNADSLLLRGTIRSSSAVGAMVAAEQGYTCGGIALRKYLGSSSEIDMGPMLFTTPATRYSKQVGLPRYHGDRVDK